MSEVYVLQGELPPTTMLLCTEEMCWEWGLGINPSLNIRELHGMDIEGNVWCSSETSFPTAKAAAQADNVCLSAGAILVLLQHLVLLLLPHLFWPLALAQFHKDITGGV